MKQAMLIILQARRESRLRNANLVVTVEAGKVVDVFLDENIKDKTVFEQLTEILTPLTGKGFYGKLKLSCINDEIPLAKIEKTIKLS